MARARSSPFIAGSLCGRRYQTRWIHSHSVYSRGGDFPIVLQAIAAQAIWNTPPHTMARLSPVTGSAALENKVPNAATPTVAPTILAVLIKADAVPDRAGETAPTARPISGPVAKPMPRPVRIRIGRASGRERGCQYG